MSIGGQQIGLGVQVHKSGLLFTAKQSLDMWEQVGGRLFSIADSSTWWIADWLVYGECTFQDRYEEAIKRTSLSYQTLRNYTWVARKFPLPRRRQALSFSHHLEVVALEQPEQDYWLRKAEELGWSRNRLRAEVRASLLTRRGEPAPPCPGNENENENDDDNRTDVDGDAHTTTTRRAIGTTGAASERALIGTGSTPDGRLLHLQLSAEDLARLERAASKQSAPLETWAADILCRAAAGS